MIPPGRKWFGSCAGRGRYCPRRRNPWVTAANNSPLYKLFQAFRRSSPQGKNGLWSRILVVKNNDRAIEMAGKFQENDPEYLDDEKWWQLVEEQDNAVLGGPTPTSPGGPAPAPTDIPAGFIDRPPSATAAAEPRASRNLPSLRPSRRAGRFSSLRANMCTRPTASNTTCRVSWCAQRPGSGTWSSLDAAAHRCGDANLRLSR